jgi:hypothetical protein
VALLPGFDEGDQVGQAAGRDPETDPWTDVRQIAATSGTRSSLDMPIL